MIYLVSFKNSDEFDIIDTICEEVSLIPINKYILNSKYTNNLPLVNGLFSFRVSGISLVFFFNENKVYYIMDGNHINYKDKVRDKLIDDILL
jgi:hypothetical protein